MMETASGICKMVRRPEGSMAHTPRECAASRFSLVFGVEEEDGASTARAERTLSCNLCMIL